MVLMKRYLLAAYAVALLSIVCGLVYADDGAISEIASGTITPLDQHGSVRMVREKVDVRLTRKRALVRCEFVFKNDGKPITVRMGFPEQARSGGDAQASGRLHNFKSTVDGIAVKTRHIGSYNKPHDKYDQREFYNGWFIKDVHFDAGQSRTIIDEYVSDLGVSNSVDSPYDAVYLFKYILKTGRSWKGSIGEAVISVNTSAFSAYCDVSPSLKGYTQRGNTITWTLKDIEPEEDIELIFFPRCPLLNGNPVENYGYIWHPYFITNNIAMAGTGFLEFVGASVNYNPENHICKIKYGNIRIDLKGGSNLAVLNGNKIIKLSCAPLFEDISDTFIIPIASVVKTLGGNVVYDKKTKRPLVYLTTLNGDKR
jgi:hypothetical protein